MAINEVKINYDIGILNNSSVRTGSVTWIRPKKEGRKEGGDNNAHFEELTRGA